MSLATSCLKRKITLGNSVAYIEPPTVRQAVEILHVLTNMEDSEDEALLFELIAGLEWHKSVDAVHKLRLLHRKNSFVFARTITNLLLQGYSPPKKNKDDDGEKDVKSYSPDWSELVHDYCRTYQSDPWTAYNLPFTFFMEMMNDRAREIARRHLDRAVEVSAGFGSKELFKKWTESAEYGKEKERAEKYSEPLTEEQINANRRNLKRRFT